MSGCIRWVRWSTGGVPRRTLGGEVKSESQVVRPFWRGGGRGTEKSAKGTFFIYIPCSNCHRVQRIKIKLKKTRITGYVRCKLIDIFRQFNKV